MPRNQTPAPGQRWEAEAPDTLDLAARAEIALNGLTGALDEERGYEICFVVHFHRRPPVMTHEVTGLPTNNPKFAESLPMMRVMCGSDLGQDAEQGMMQALVGNIADDGLYYAPAAGRPWHRGDPRKRESATEDFANVYGNARAMLAMMAWYQRDGDSAWEGRIDWMADALGAIALREGEGARYPDPNIGEAFSYPRSGWPGTDVSLDPGASPHMIHMYHSGVVRAFARWHRMRGRPQDLDFARRLSTFLRQPSLWRPMEGTRAGFEGHFHGHVACLWGLLECALEAEDVELLDFAREGYDYARSVGMPSLGWFPELVGGPHCEACCTADMVALAIKLSDAGAGDYWDDVDGYVRNQLVEQQLMRADLLDAVSRDGPETPVDEPRQCGEGVIERNLGAFAGYADPTTLPDTWIMHCCTGNATQALYYAWESAVRARGEAVEVNLLLNRASPWMDVESRLPFEGRAVFRVKKALRLSVRLPRDVAAREVAARVNGRAASPRREGRRLVFDSLAPGDEVTLEFPVEERTERFVVDGTEYRARFRGATLVDIRPRAQSPAGYPIYLRDHLRATHAPLRIAMRCVSPLRIGW